MFTRILLVFALLAGTMVSAVADEWEKLGTRTVSFKPDREEIDVDNQGRFVAVKFEVEDGRIEMYNIRITFGDGEVFSPDTRCVFNEDTRSRTIDLPGNERVIKKINFFCKSIGHRGRGKVEVFGKRSEKNVRWENLGSQKVGFQREKDTIQVGRREGRFTAIRIEVEGGDVEMYNMRVFFPNGESFSPDVRHAFREGQRTRSIDLPGEARTIERVEFFYRSERKRGEVTVTLFGRQAESRHDHDHHDRKEPRDRYKGWDHIGTRQVDFRAEKDTIVVRGDNTFRELRVEVEDGSLEIYNMKITFKNGETISPDVRHEFREGSRTRDIDLPGRKRSVEKIEFFYRSKGRGGKATVHVYGR